MLELSELKEMCHVAMEVAPNNLLRGWPLGALAYDWGLVDCNGEDIPFTGWGAHDVVTDYLWGFVPSGFNEEGAIWAFEYGGWGESAYERKPDGDCSYYEWAVNAGLYAWFKAGKELAERG